MKVHFIRWLLFFIIIVDGISFGLITPIITPLLTHFPSDLLGKHSSLLYPHIIFSVTMALFPFGAIVGSIFLGRFSDYYGRKKMLCFGLGGTLLSYLLMGYSLFQQSILLLMLGRFLSGFASLGNRPIAQAIMADISNDKQRAINISLIALAMTIAMALGPLLGGVLSDPHILRSSNNTTPFLIAAILATVNLTLIAYFFKESFQSHMKQISPQPLRSLWQEKGNKNLLQAFFLLEAGWGLYFQSIPLLLSEKFHYQNAQLGLFLCYTGLCMSLGLTFLFRHLLKKFSLLSTARSSAIVATIALLFCAIPMHSGNWQWTWVAPLAVFIGIQYTALVSLLSQSVNQNLQGSMMGLVGGLLALAWCFSGLLIAPLATISIFLPNLIATLFICSCAVICFKSSLLPT